ncbi:tautomerase family protein [Bartonella sp. DGB2]|uniref:tautomerase family protein n=1 Tax=Bartonella sp. DGB2 TaxID=3388426 RepID=UPI00398F9204
MINNYHLCIKRIININCTKITKKLLVKRVTELIMDIFGKNLQNTILVTDEFNTNN